MSINDEEISAEHEFAAPELSNNEEDDGRKSQPILEKSTDNRKNILSKDYEETVVERAADARGGAQADEDAEADGNEDDGRKSQPILEKSTDNRKNILSKDYEETVVERAADARGGAQADEDAEADGNEAANTHVVAHHYNELKESVLKDRHKSKIFYMRNFNNWIKSQLINEYMGLIKQQSRIGEPLRVLDMCCGKGGDLLKWDKSNISHLICTDIAEVSVEQCQRRYQDILQRAEKSKFGNKFTAEFFACDSTMVRLRERYKDASLQLRMVSCQFAFHYCFESVQQADCMMRNAAECLQPGGYFIATIPDAYEIVRRLRAAGPNARSFGNELYSISFECDTETLPLFGAKYLFHLEGVVDCPEFLVHFPTLIKLGRRHGLKLVRRTTFAEYYQEKLAQGRQLLQRMSGLEPIQVNQCGNDEEYEHLRSLLGGQHSRVVGTLSKSEWAATTLYMVCAFVKCKNTWDANGKPVFDFDD